MKGRYAVFGDPIVHSLSPRIHAAFGAQCGIALDYRAIEAGHDAFPAALDAFAREGGRGANVTLPLKEDAVARCTTLSGRARRCGSVNTLIRDGDDWRGDSTDGAGFLRDLERHRVEPLDMHVLLLGAGGAARAVAFALVDAGVGELAIANRNPGRSAELVAAVGDACVHAVEWPTLAACGGAPDLVINATSAGHAGTALTWPSTLVASHTVCYDLSYGRAAEPFIAWAQACGAATAADGLGMLVEQAAESFALWHGLDPDTAPVLVALRG
jgi:shikimate dehydrogenase